MSQRMELALEGSANFFGNWLMSLVTASGDVDLGELNNPSLEVSVQKAVLKHTRQTTRVTARERVRETEAKLSGSLMEPFHPDTLASLRAGGRDAEINRAMTVGLTANKPSLFGKSVLTLNGVEGALPGIAALQSGLITAATDGGTGGGGSVASGTYKIWAVPVYYNPRSEYTSAFALGAGTRGWDMIYGNPSEPASVTVAAGSSTIACTGVGLATGVANYARDLTTADYVPDAIALVAGTGATIATAKIAKIIPVGDDPGTLSPNATITAIAGETFGAVPADADDATGLVLVQTIDSSSGSEVFTTKTPGTDYTFNAATGELTIPDGSSIALTDRLRVCVWTGLNASLAIAFGAPVNANLITGIRLRNFETEDSDSQDKSVLGAEVYIPQVNRSSIGTQLIRASADDFSTDGPVDFDILEDAAIGGYGKLTVYTGKLEDYYSPVIDAA